MELALGPENAAMCGPFVICRDLQLVQALAGFAIDVRFSGSRKQTHSHAPASSKDKSSSTPLGACCLRADTRLCALVIVPAASAAAS
jgi:hypothetical protein